MAKTQRDKFDLLTLAIKHQLIGTDIIVRDIVDDVEVDVALEVKDWYIDYATSQIHIDFTDGSDDMFDLNQKYFVNIEVTYKSIPQKRNRRRRKRQND